MKSPTEKICEVIRWMASNKNLPVSAIEDRCSIPRGNIGKWLSGDRRSVSSESVGKILLAFPEVSADFVMRDKGGMFEECTASTDLCPEETDELNRLRDENRRLKELLEASRTYIKALEQIK